MTTEVLLAKDYWRNRENPCDNAQIIFDFLAKKAKGDPQKIIEFGCNWGGNLKYFMDRLQKVVAVGVDINDIALKLAKQCPRYTPIIGDEKTLSQFSDKEFDFAFTVSVLDHMPSLDLMKEAMKNLIRISVCALFLEPWIEGIEGDVSGKTRDSIKPGLQDGREKFHPFSCLWNYDAILDGLGVKWTKTTCPLHRESLGPFYHIYFVENGKTKSA